MEKKSSRFGLTIKKFRIIAVRIKYEQQDQDIAWDYEDDFIGNISIFARDA